MTKSKLRILVPDLKFIRCTLPATVDNPVGLSDVNYGWLASLQLARPVISLEACEINLASRAHCDLSLRYIHRITITRDQSL